MPESQDAPALSMREMVSRSGVSEGTLRMWEARYGFPVPDRLPSGHRRYSAEDLRRVRAVLGARDRGLSLRAAIERARNVTAAQRPSVYSALRESFPQLVPQLLPKHALVSLSRAIEDEGLIRANRPLLFGCFQRERFYRQVQSRWQELARTADHAVVLADFKRKREHGAGPAELPIRPSDPVMREWVVVCESPRFAAALAAVERPTPEADERRFETIWTVEGAPVREAARVCCELAEKAAPGALEAVRERLADPMPPERDELRDVIELATRMVLYAISGP